MTFNRNQNPLTRLLDKAQRRFRSARPGSVLILVIVLLVLLALLGTAYLSTTRNDRLSSVASYQNSTVDQYVNGIASVVQGELIDATFDHSGLYAGSGQYRYRFCDRGAYNATFNYQQGDVVIGSNGYTYLCNAAVATNVTSDPASTTPPPAGWTQTFYRNFDSIGFNSGSLIAERQPMYDTPNHSPYWPSITPLLLPSSNFEDPTKGIASQPASFPLINLYPVNGLQMTAGYGGNAITGCDADGDGVPDSYLFRIPGAFSDGLTWYAGVRILDDNSAINVNTAWSSTTDIYGLFPTSVGLADILTSGDSLTSTTPVGVQTYRADGTDGIHAVDDSYAPVPTGARGDYQFVTVADALNSQLIRRLKNPGYGEASASVFLPYRAIPESETAVMAHGFVIRDSSQAIPSLLEQMLPGSTYNSPVLTAAYNSSNFVNWYPNNFNLPSDAATVTKPLRSILVARNPVSNYIPAVYDPNNAGEPLSPFMLPYNTGTTFITGGAANYSHYKGVFNVPGSMTTTFNFNDIVVENGRTYISVAANNVGHDPQNGSSLYGNYAFWQLQPWTQNPVKANVNTASFRELFRAYSSVMAGNLTGTTTPTATYYNYTPFGSDSNPATTPINYATSYNPYYYTDNTQATVNVDPQHMFRSPIRDPNYASTANAGTVTRMDAANTLLIRAALAAVNTIGLRSQTQDVISRTIYLNATLGGVTPANPDNYANASPGSGNENVEVRVYSNAPQPFISEIIADNDTSTNKDTNSNGGTNPKGYIGIELYNPYPFAITMTNWQLAVIPRPTGGTYPVTGLQIPPTALAAIPTTTIAAHSCVLLENYPSPPLTAGANDATYRPAAAFPGKGTGALTTSVYIAGLDAVMGGGELTILRPRSASGVPTANTTDPLNLYNEGTVVGTVYTPNLVDLVPVDSYDFTNFTAPSPTATTYIMWHYLRSKEENPPGSGQVFKCVYPGRYSTIVAGATFPRQLDTKVYGFDYATTTPTYPVLAPVANFTFLSGASTTASYNSFAPIQIFNQGMPGPNPLIASAGNATAPTTPQFPFGGFARNGDILDVPYIGAYRIRNGTQVIELNSLSMDCSFADQEDTNVADEANENIGRFCPLTSATFTPTNLDCYNWARNLFTYLTVQTPTDDYMPSFDPGAAESDTTGKYTPGNSVPATATPSPVNSSDATITDHTAQDNVGQDGLVNINTAPWKVLATLPLVPGGASNANNQTLAQAIVAYRQLHGPFTSIMDLNRVGTTALNFQNAWGGLSTTAPTTGAGLLAPPDNFPPNGTPPTGTVTSGVVGPEFQGQFANLTRISNLITTRSDTYTVYICVEGWQNANSTNAALPPALKVVRRYAFVADRSAVNSLVQSRFLKTLAVPNN